MSVDIRVEHLGKTVAGLPILRDVSLEARSGQTVAIVGKSGSGKSTLLSVLGLLDTFESGSYDIGGVGVRQLPSRQREAVRGAAIGFIFQRFALLPHLTAVENVMMPLRHMQRRLRLSARSMRALALDELDRVGLSGKHGRLPRQLSGGEQQRVAIARSLVHGPELVLADEPTGSLDVETGRRVVKLLVDRAQATGSCLIVVTHDEAVARSMQRTLILDSGELKALP